MTGWGTGRYGATDMMNSWGMAFGEWAWMAIWIVALVAMVWVIVAGYRDRSPRDEPLDLLRGRFARGEISEDEYERARSVLLGERRSTR